MRFSEFYFYAQHFPPQHSVNKTGRKKKCWVAVTEEVMRAMPPHIGAKHYKKNC
jgi:hypothetical protein